MKNKSLDLNVFVATTPLQLMSCSEARYHFGCPEQTCLLVLARPDNRETEKQMAFLSDALGWRSIETVFLGKTGFLLRLAGLLRRLSKSPPERLFIGNKNSWFHEAFYRALKANRTLFVDDGLATLRYYRAIHDKSFDSRLSHGKHALLSALRVPLRPLSGDNLEFFTCFPLESSDRIRVEVHDFPVFRQTFHTQCGETDASPVVAFIGQPFGAGDRLAQVRAQVSYVAGRHPASRLVYFMHRKEERSELERELAEIPVEIRQTGRPIEIEVATSGSAYLAFYSFASTALFTLKKIYPASKVYQIDDQIFAAQLPYYDEIVGMLHSIGVVRTSLEQVSSL
ncbi:hypothetical protein LPB19_06615 [Marinobacter salinisoli]|uniref:Uncharacterized protein n=1 Tax=Marinobacter salinisoli TaxID=2769486 RepID=A0ABX7MUR9_9GAMM|nr:hypothetical protein [Marinobacter salinisoli]QSP96054.1 hypothetical protein LPB19_06615 [Marinobacter salinisoli]